MRAVTIPVAGPVIDGGADAIREAWAALRVELRQRWDDAARLANWTVRELAKSEPVVAAGERLGAAPAPYLYPGARKVAPDLSPACVVALQHAVTGSYRRRRLEAIGRSQISLPSYRSPHPLPFGGEWRPTVGKDGVPLVSGRLSASAAGRRWTLRLRAGPGHRRALEVHRQILAGEAVLVEVAILGERGHRGDHRPQIESRPPGGGARENTGISVKLVAWMPRERRTITEGPTLYVRSAKDCLVTYSLEDGTDAYRLNADHVRRWVAEHRRKLQRTSDDLKREKRWPASVRRGMVSRRQVWAEKQGRRLDSFTHESSAMLVAFAQRRKVARVVLDFADRGYVQSFPWHQLTERLRYKLDGAGIAYEDASCLTTSDSVSVETAESTGASCKKRAEVGRSHGSKKSSGAAAPGI